MYCLSLKWCEHIRPFKKNFSWHTSPFTFENFQDAQDYALELVDCGVKKLGRSKYPFHRVVEYKVYPLEIYYDD